MKIILIKLNGATEQDVQALAAELENTEFCKSRPDYTIMVSNKTYKAHTLDTNSYEALEEKLADKKNIS